MGGAFGFDVTVKQKWEIESFEVREVRVLGWAGPAYTSIQLRKYEFFGFIYQRIDSNIVEDNVCIREFNSSSEGSFIFNQCEGTLIYEEGR